MSIISGSICQLIQKGARLLIIVATLMLLSSCGGSGGDSGTGGTTGELPGGNGQTTGGTGETTGGTGGTTITSGPMATGAFRFQILESDDPELVFPEAFTADITASIDSPVTFVNSAVSLPGNDLPIFFTLCDEANAFFNPNVPQIVMCYELLDVFFQQYLSIFEGVEDEDEQISLAYDASFSAFNFVLLHEIAHALHSILELGIAGNSESAADAIATVLSVEQDRSEFPFLAAILLLENEDGSFGDVHSGGLDRGGDILCWTLGGDPALASDENLGTLVNLFVEAGRDCVGEYGSQEFAVHGWIPALSNQTTIATAPKLEQHPSISLQTLDAPVKRELAARLGKLLPGRI